MSVNTRGGLKADFDPNKMTENEIAGTWDTKEIFYTFAPGDVKQLATKEDFQADLDALDSNIERAEHAYLAAESLLVNKAGINDVTPTLSEAYSGAKTQSLIDNISIDDLSTSTATFTQATVDADIATGDTLAVLFGKILKRFATIATSLAGKFSKADIVNSDTVNDITKVPSSAVTFALGAEIDTNKTAIATINTNLAYEKILLNALTTSYLQNPENCYVKIKSGVKALKLYSQSPVNLLANTQYALFTLPIKYRPEDNVDNYIIIKSGVAYNYAMLTIAKTGVVSIYPYSIITANSEYIVKTEMYI